MIKILKRPDEVFPYLKEIGALADSQKNELGFIPYSAYEDSCYKGNLVVAIAEGQKGEDLFAGYVLLGGRYPTKRIFQLAVSPNCRRKGIGKLLVNAVCESAEKLGFYKIVIRVGKTMDANKFWKKSGFILARTQEGGAVHPVLNVMFREIVPTIFSLASQQRTGLRQVVSGIPARPVPYLLDTNIIIDISTKRDATEASENLMLLVGKGDINVAVAQASVNELELYRQLENDLPLNMTDNLPVFSLVHDDELKSELRDIIFPSKNDLSQRDISDLENVATAVKYTKGFITRDGAILRQHETLWNKFSLEVLSPSDFLEESEVRGLSAMEMGAISSEEILEITPNPTEVFFEDLAGIFPKHEINKDKFAYAFLKINEEITAGCAIQKRRPVGGRARDAILFALNKDNSGARAVSLMLDFIFKQPSPSSAPASTISLAVHGRAEQLDDTLIDRGYYPADDGKYRKICAGPIICSKNWQEKKKEIKKMSQISLPNTIPNYENFDQDVVLENNVSVSLQALEDFLSSILLLPNRDGVIVPIKQEYADDFFAHSSQESLLSPPEAQLSWYKSYFGTSRVKSRLLTGRLLFFYQSKSQGGKGEVVACARIVRSNIASKNKTSQEAMMRGVLDQDGLQHIIRADTVLETVFTHSVVFPMPVPLERLREIGCDDKANFVTAYGIGPQRTHDLINEGGVL